MTFWRKSNFYQLVFRRGLPVYESTGEVSYDVLKPYPREPDKFYPLRKFHSEEEMKMWLAVNGIGEEEYEEIDSRLDCRITKS